MRVFNHLAVTTAVEVNRGALSINTGAVLALAAVLLIPGAVSAETIYSDRAVFEAQLAAIVVDNYSKELYVDSFYTDDEMNAVLGETKYQSTSFSNSVKPSGYYCTGCNGSFLLDFRSTSVSDDRGVFGVGLDIKGNEKVFGTTAFVTFGDGSTLNQPIPDANPSTGDMFWGISDSRSISTIHFGLANGGANRDNGVQRMALDNLTVGSAVLMDRGPGFLYADGRIVNDGGKFVAYYDLDFRFPQPGAVFTSSAEIEFELQGDMNPDGSKGSSLLISFPLASLVSGQARDGAINQGTLWAFNPTGLRIRQLHQSYIWDFPVGATGTTAPGESKLFVSYQPPEAHQVGQIFMRLVIYDNRTEPGDLRPAIPNLLAGNPTLRIGRYEWSSQIQTMRFSSKWGWADWLFRW